MSTIAIHPREGGGYSLLLEGHDISHLVAADGIEISFGQRLTRRLGETGLTAASPTVRITLAAGLETHVELPDALVETLTADVATATRTEIDEYDRTFSA